MTEDWESRIGPVAARWRRLWVVYRSIALICLATVVPCGTVTIVLWANWLSEPQPLLWSFTIAAILLVILLFAVGMTSPKLRFDALDEAYTFVRRTSPSLTYAEIERGIRSIVLFDETVASASQASRSSESGSDVVASWTPNIRAALRPGPTARVLLDWAHGILIVAVVCLLGYSGYGATGRFPPLPVWQKLGESIAGVLLLGILVWLVALARSRFEVHHGYSTAAVSGYLLSERGKPRMFDLYLSVDRVDGRTGYVLRQVGEPRLDYDTYLIRRRQIREAHPRDRPLRSTE